MKNSPDMVRPSTFHGLHYTELRASLFLGINSNLIYESERQQLYLFWT